MNVAWVVCILSLAAGADAGGVVQPITLACEMPDPDRDGDGLPDYQELHKYFTDPIRADSDGDGTPDGDWSERREYAYTVRVVLRVMPPVTEAALCDDYQDARVLSRTAEYVELEAVLYPFNTNAQAIVETADWHDNRATHDDYLRTRPSANWNAAMQSSLLKALADEDQDVSRMTDRQATQAVADHVLRRCTPHNHFNAFHARFENGKAVVAPGREQAVRDDMRDPTWTAERQFEDEVLGREMYNHRTRGTCTSTAVLLTTALRAVGIPTRMILCTPLVDASGGDNIDLVRKGITNTAVRKVLLDALTPLRGSNASHTFNEVYIGGRWRRLNGDRIGQNTFDRNCFGLLVHVNTFYDLSDAGLDAWGGRKPNGVFRYANAYTATEVSDAVGSHAVVTEPAAAASGAISKLIIAKVRWLEDENLPARVRESSFAEDGSGHLFLHVRKPSGSATQEDYAAFYEKAAKTFLLTAKGQPSIAVKAERGWWLDSSNDCREFYARIAPNDRKKMRTGLQYRLSVKDQRKDAAWEIDPKVEVALPTRAAASAPARQFRITRLRWLGADDLPEPVRNSEFAEDGSGHLFLHCVGIKRGLDMQGVNKLYEAAPRQFRLVAKGHPTVKAAAERGFWFDGGTMTCEFYVRVPADEKKKLKTGVAYAIESTGKTDGTTWTIDDAARISAP